MAARGTHKNPTDKGCFELCTACLRCANKNSYVSNYNHCGDCSGHHDPHGEIDPHPDDFCDCANGKMRWVVKNGPKRGLVVIRNLPHNPFEGDIKVHGETADERDWKAFLEDTREKLNDENWNPIEVYDSAKDPYAALNTEAAKYQRGRK